MRRVLVIECGSLVEKGVERILMRAADTDVVGVAWEDESTLLEQVLETHPDVVVLNEACPVDFGRPFSCSVTIQSC